MDEFTWVLWRKEINVRLSEPPHLLSNMAIAIIFSIVLECICRKCVKKPGWPAREGHSYIYIHGQAWYSTLTHNLWINLLCLHTLGYEYSSEPRTRQTLHPWDIFTPFVILLIKPFSLSDSVLGLLYIVQVLFRFLFKFPLGFNCFLNRHHLGFVQVVPIWVLFRLFGHNLGSVCVPILFHPGSIWNPFSV